MRTVYTYETKGNCLITRCNHGSVGGATLYVLDFVAYWQGRSAGRQRKMWTANPYRGQQWKGPKQRRAYLSWLRGYKNGMEWRLTS